MTLVMDVRGRVGAPPKNRTSNASRPDGPGDAGASAGRARGTAHAHADARRGRARDGESARDRTPTRDGQTDAAGRAGHGARARMPPRRIPEPIAT
jgi:hypothetical protein